VLDAVLPTALKTVGLTPVGVANDRSTPRHIWLCADDYGMSPAVNVAIRDLVVRRRLNATSVMTVAPSFHRSEAHALAVLNSGAARVAIGLHVTLTAPFQPLSDGYGPLRNGKFLSLGATMAHAFLHRLDGEALRRENAQELLQQAVFLQRVAHPDIAFSIQAPKEAVYFGGDGRLIAQALTNVLKNAGESIAARHAKGDEVPGKIHVALETAKNSSGITSLVFRVTDNGVGLPPEHRHRLTEPYVTTRAKGTGSSFRCRMTMANGPPSSEKGSLPESSS